MTTEITVTLQGTTVSCTPDKGNAWVRDGQIKWIPGNNVARLKLDFYKKNMQNNGATSNWPFDERPNPPGSSSTGWQTGFTGTVKQESGAYDYTVEVERVAVDGLGETFILDPMIIVGRG